MTGRISLRRKLLLAFLVACALVSLGAWAVLAATICSNPRAPIPETQHVIAYNCHGMTVFISYLQNSMLHWLFPAFAFFSLLAATLALMTIVKVRIDVRVEVTDRANSGSGRHE